MSSEEKRAWIMVVVTVVSYLAYVVIIVGRAEGRSPATVPYAATMLWTIGSAIVASIVLHIAVNLGTPRGAGLKDQRDRDISHFGEGMGQAFGVIGSVCALGLAMLRADYFWIANVIYLGFALSALVSSAAKIIAYRRGLPSW